MEPAPIARGDPPQVALGDVGREPGLAPIEHREQGRVRRHPVALPEGRSPVHHHAAVGSHQRQPGPLALQAPHPPELRVQLGVDHQLAAQQLPVQPSRLALPAKLAQPLSGHLQLVLELGHVDLHQQIARLHPVAVRHGQALDPPGLGGVERLVATLQGGRGEDRAAPGHEQQAQPHGQQKGRAQERPARAHLAPARRPLPDLARHRTHQEVADLHGEEEDSQHLDEEVVDDQGDREEQKEAIGPQPQAVGDEAPAGGLRRRVPEGEQALAQPPAGQCRAPRLEVRDAHPVREHVVAVEAHEGVHVDEKRDQPGGGGEQEAGALGHARGQERPGQERQGRDPQLDLDPGGADGPALPPGGQAPGLRGVRVEHRPEDQEGHPDRGNAAAPGLGGVGVAELVEDLHAGDHGGVGEEARQVEEVQERGEEEIELAAGQVEADQATEPQGRLRGRGAEPSHPGEGPLQEPVRPGEGDAHEQVAPGEPLEELRRALALLPVPLLLAGVGDHQVVPAQEGDDGLDVVGVDLALGLGPDALRHGVGVAGLDRRQDLDLPGSQPVVAARQGIVQHPGRRPVRVGIHRHQAQLLAQPDGRRGRGLRRRGGGLRLGSGGYHPVHSRRAATGRRKR